MLDRTYFENRKKLVEKGIADYQAKTDEQLIAIRHIRDWHERQDAEVKYQDDLRTLRWLQGRLDEIYQALRTIQQLEEIKPADFVECANRPCERRGEHEIETDKGQVLTFCQLCKEAYEWGQASVELEINPW